MMKEVRSKFTNSLQEEKKKKKKKEANCWVVLIEGK
jgi:hypothetical protein